MRETIHQRAERLIAESLVEGLSAADRSWLGAHLGECSSCAQQSAALHALVQAVRTVPVVVPSNLAARAQLRVHLRGREVAEASLSGPLLWVLTGASWLLGILSAPLVWRLFAWAGTQLHLPKPALELAFVLWWAVPALVAVAAVLHERLLREGSRSERFRSPVP